METLSNIGSFFSDLYNAAYCYFKPSDQACTASSPEAAADHFKQVQTIQEVRLQELIHQSEPVRVGCYIEMHQVPNLNIHQLEEAVRQHRAPASKPRH
jgi:hypothetical protein